MTLIIRKKLEKSLLLLEEASLSLIDLKLYLQRLEEYTTYFFRVRGFTVRYGNWSDVFSVRTMCSRPLHAPKLERIYSISPQSVAVTWQPPPFSPHVGEVIAYKIIFTDDVRQNDEHWMSQVSYH